MIRGVPVAGPVALRVLAVPLVLSGCYPKVGAAPGPVASETMAMARAKWADATPEAVEQGRQAFLDHCNKCHGYPEVGALPELKWPATAKRMAAKAQLSAADTEDLTRFVLALRASPPPSH